MSRERAIGPFTFPTRKAAEAAVRGVLYRTGLGQPLAGDDRVLIESLLRIHHEAQEKIGPGVADIVVRTGEYRTRCFWVVRTDGSAIDFSFRTALDGARSPADNVRSAMRFAVRGQVDDFRAAWFDLHADADGTVACPLSGRRVARGPEAHVDHVVPFADLAEEYLALAGGVQNVRYRQGAGHMGAELRGLDAQAWPAFHLARAELRVVHACANLERGRGRGDAT